MVLRDVAGFSLGVPVPPRLLPLPLLPQPPSLLAPPPLGVVGLPGGVPVVVIPEQVLVDGAGFPEGADAAEVGVPVRGWETGPLQPFTSTYSGKMKNRWNLVCWQEI